MKLAETSLWGVSPRTRKNAEFSVKLALCAALILTAGALRADPMRAAVDNELSAINDYGRRVSEKPEASEQELSEWKQTIIAPASEKLNQTFFSQTEKRLRAAGVQFTGDPDIKGANSPGSKDPVRLERKVAGDAAPETPLPGSDGESAKRRAAFSTGEARPDNTVQGEQDVKRISFPGKPKAAAPAPAEGP